MDPSLSRVEALPAALPRIRGGSYGRRCFRASRASGPRLIFRRGLERMLI